jgi:proteasome lid subunit RPN8/RPN11
LARSSAQAVEVERCWVLLGQRRGRVWYARRTSRQQGERFEVRFNGQEILGREEARGDVVGFYHTHPAGPAVPSRRDVRTMRAWCSSFGKSLLCVIDSPTELRGYRFDEDGSYHELALVEVFPRSVVIGVEFDGEQVPS